MRTNSLSMTPNVTAQAYFEVRFSELQDQSDAAIEALCALDNELPREEAAMEHPR